MEEIKPLCDIVCACVERGDEGLDRVKVFTANTPGAPSHDKAACVLSLQGENIDDVGDDGKGAQGEVMLWLSAKECEDLACVLVECAVAKRQAGAK